jgi:hypothetical protein
MEIGATCLGLIKGVNHHLFPIIFPKGLLGFDKGCVGFVSSNVCRAWQ